jgi:predicted RNase H-like HicB family nuclease
LLRQNVLTLDEVRGTDGGFRAAGSVIGAALRGSIHDWCARVDSEGCMTTEKSLIGYVMVFEKSSAGYHAYVPDLPGCIATGRTLDETQKLMREAMAPHLKGMRADKIRLSRPRSLAELRRRGLIR